MTSPADAPATIPLQSLFADLDIEMAGSRAMLERFPPEHADWKPHEKSMSLADLATHVAELPLFGAAIAEKPEWVAGVDKFERVKGRTREELLAIHERAQAHLRGVLAAMTPDGLEHVWRMRKGDFVFLEGDRTVLLRRMLFSHIAHHRGQLTVYYRMLGVPLPPLYGPTADG